MVSGKRNKLNSASIYGFIFACFVCTQSSAEITISSDFHYLNKIRTEAGINHLKWSETLSNAAQNHANYLTENNQLGHHELLGRRHYSGEWAADRALFSDYPNRLVSENVTSKSGDNKFYNPIDSLMSAIYHRFGFLDLNKNEAGIGHQFGSISSYVYVLGNSNISDICQQPAFEGFGKFVYQICANKKHKIEAGLIDQLNLKLLNKNPAITTWPAANSKNISPVFYQESPDPLPFHKVSGYPVSIEFNPAYFVKAPVIKSFLIFQQDSDKSLESIVLMNAKNDPNKQFSEYQHAFFPTHRLNWNQQYNVKVDYFDPNMNQTKQIAWSFNSMAFDAPIITINSDDQLLEIEPNQDTILYFPPKNANDVDAALGYRDKGMDLNINYIDKNTLIINVKHNGSAEITFHRKTIKLSSSL